MPCDIPYKDMITVTKSKSVNVVCIVLTTLNLVNTMDCTNNEESTSIFFWDNIVGAHYLPTHTT